MNVPAGEVAYHYGSTGQCSAVGLTWSKRDFEIAIGERIMAITFDDEGRSNIRTFLTNVAETGFNKDDLEQTLKDPASLEDWRVGEAIAESYLTDHRSCYFPWPDGRDERKSGSSLPGADLVGFGIDDDGDCLAFGEIKTSSEKNYPPSSIYGKSGLRSQLEDLRDKKTIRDDLLKYLIQRVNQATWQPKLEAASKRYLNNSSDVQLYGVLIRDVQPHSKDLRSSIDALDKDLPNRTRIELIAIYLPENHINRLGEAVLSQRQRAKT